MDGEDDTPADLRAGRLTGLYHLAQSVAMHFCNGSGLVEIVGFHR
jgi:hypothetical protein